MIMKKIFVSIVMLTLTLGAEAQMTPEAIMGNCPAVPSAESLVDYFVKQSNPELGDDEKHNAAVDAYFKQLADARKRATKYMDNQPIPSDAFAKQRARQLKEHSKAKAGAAANMNQFLATLTLAQQEALKKCKNEQESMAYLKKIGRWDAFTEMMSGSGAPNTDTGLTKEEQEWSSKDLTADIEADQRRREAAAENRIALFSKYQEAKAVMDEKAGEIWGKLLNAQEGATNHGSGSVLNLRAQLKDLLTGFYKKWVPQWINMHNTEMEAWKLSLDVSKKKDKKNNALRQINGMGPLSVYEREDFGTAIMYLDKAADILLGENYEYPEEE